jgi:hypothetical protein
MLKKTLLALGLAALLAIPAGVAFAYDPPADVTQEQQSIGDRDRLRVRDPGVCGACASMISDDATVAEPMVARDRDQAQVRDRDRDCGVEGAIQERAQAREQMRDQVHIQGSEQARAQNGEIASGFRGMGAGGEYGHRYGVDS